EAGHLAFVIVAEAQHLVVGDATGPGDKTGAGLKGGKLLPEDQGGVLKHFFGVVIVVQQRKDVPVDFALVPGEQANEFFAVNRRRRRPILASLRSHAPGVPFERRGRCQAMRESTLLSYSGWGRKLEGAPVVRFAGCLAGSRRVHSMGPPSAKRQIPCPKTTGLRR